MAATTGIHHASLSVSDLERSAAWYERVLDLELVMNERGDGRSARVYRLTGSQAMFAIVAHDANDGGRFSPITTGLDHVAFEVAERADVDTWADHLDELGVEHSGPIDVPTGAILNLADPDGIQLAIFWEGGPR